MAVLVSKNPIHGAVAFQTTRVDNHGAGGAMGKQCYKCNSIARYDAPNCLACGAPFGPIPSQTRARRMLAFITVAVVVAFLLVFVLTKTR